MKQITGYLPPAIAWMRRASRPAAMEASTKRSLRAARTGAMDSSIPAIIWGFTPRKISEQVRATVSLSEAWTPRYLARASALAGVRVESRIEASGAPFTAARATAEPMVPVLMKPMVLNMCVPPSVPVEQTFLHLYHNTSFNQKEEKSQIMRAAPGAQKGRREKAMPLTFSIFEL